MYKYFSAFLYFSKGVKLAVSSFAELFSDTAREIATINRIRAINDKIKIT